MNDVLPAASLPSAYTVPVDTMADGCRAVYSQGVRELVGRVIKKIKESPQMFPSCVDFSGKNAFRWACGGIALWFGVVAGVSAAPSVTSIELIEGEATVAVSGSGFGPGPKVAFFDDFESGENGDKLGAVPVRVGKLQVNRPPVYVGYSHQWPDTGFLIRDPSLALNFQQLMATVVFPEASEVFFHYAIHVPEGNNWPTVPAGQDGVWGTVSSWKMAWLMRGSNGFSSQTIFDLCVPQHPGHGIAQISGNAGLGPYPPRFSAWWDWHGLNNVSFWMQRSAPTSSNRANAYFRTTSKAFKTAVTQWADSAYQKDGVDIVFDRVNFPGWFRPDNADSFNAVYDNIYVAYGENSRARIEVSNARKLEDATFVMVIAPQEWVDGTIRFRVPNIVARTNEEFFVRIYKNDGSILGEGLRICLNCPRPPVLL